VLQLQFEALEHWARPQILCTTANAALPDAHVAFALATAIKQAALAAGFAPDLKPFRAHVTVARKVARAPEVQPMPRVTWNCEAFALVASTTGATGSVYSVLESYPLDRSENARK
jgi:RNA 2',3'-cyclic 3'-phosphodiesterase